MPFFNLFLERQGLRGTQIGLIGTVSSFTVLVSAPLWGRWSDRVAHPRRLLQAAFLGSAVIHLFISQQSAFLWLAVLVCLEGLISVGVMPISDTMAFDASQRSSRSGFGSIRLWGSLGWAIVVMISGWLIEQTGLVFAFVGYAVTIVITALVVNLLDRPDQSHQETRHKTGTSPSEILREIGKDRALVGLAIALSIWWITRAGTYQFEAIYLDRLGAGESIIGLSSTIGALVELPAILWADHLVRRYGSHWMLRVTLLLHAGMAAAVLVIPTVPTIIAMRAVGGVAFSFYSVAIVLFIGERDPLTQIVTTMALYSSTLRGLFSIFGSPLNGLAFDVFGAYWLYAIAFGGSMLSWLVLKLMVTGKRSQVLVNGK